MSKNKSGLHIGNNELFLQKRKFFAGAVKSTKKKDNYLFNSKNGYFYNSLERGFCLEQIADEISLLPSVVVFYVARKKTFLIVFSNSLTETRIITADDILQIAAPIKYWLLMFSDVILVDFPKESVAVVCSQVGRNCRPCEDSELIAAIKRSRKLKSNSSRYAGISIVAATTLLSLFVFSAAVDKLNVLIATKSDDLFMQGSKKTKELRSLMSEKRKFESNEIKIYDGDLAHQNFAGDFLDMLPSTIYVENGKLKNAKN